MPWEKEPARNSRPERSARDYPIAGLDQITSEPPFRKLPRPFRAQGRFSFRDPGHRPAASAPGWVLAARWAAARGRRRPRPWNSIGAVVRDRGGPTDDFAVRQPDGAGLLCRGRWQMRRPVQIHEGSLSLFDNHGYIESSEMCRASAYMIGSWRQSQANRSLIKPVCVIDDYSGESTVVGRDRIPTMVAG